MRMATHAYGNTCVWQHMRMATHAYGNTCVWQHMRMATHAYGNICIWQHMQCSIHATHSFVVLFHLNNYICPAYIFHVISISHGILASGMRVFRNSGFFLTSGVMLVEIYIVGSIFVTLSYIDAKGNSQTANVSNVFKKCAKAGHICGVTYVNVCFHIRVIRAIFQ